jgi:hypothetical protein
MPLTILKDLFSVLGSYGDQFDYVRFNSHFSYDNKVFVGGKNESSKKDCDKPLSTDTWRKLKEEPRKTIEELVGSECPADKA